MTAGPYFLDLGLDKFEVCCAVLHSGELCESDATEELIAAHPEGQTFYIPVCNEKLHVLKAVNAKKHIESGKDPRILSEIAFSGIYLQPQGFAQKCKTTEWDKHSFSFPVPTIILESSARKKSPKVTPVQSVVRAQSERSLPVPAEWTWVEDSFRWMDTDGEIKPLSKISPQHLIVTALAIRDANYQSCPKKMSWTKELVAPNFKIQYPEESLSVGLREARAKLEEFEEVLARMGVL